MILVSFLSSDATTVITQPVDADGNAIGPAAFTEI